jgi:N-acetylglucosaminyldiphosphoundecaprenol N-acetyl-beta-D-mannosaminyltransferase
MTVPVRPLGVRVDPVSMDEAVERIRIRLREGPPGYVVTLNAVMLGRAAKDAEFRRVVHGAVLVTADGMGTLLAARILGMRIPERVAGVDLADRLCALCAAEGFRLFLFGAAEGVADLAARHLRSRHPGLDVAGSQHGYGAIDDGSVAEGIRRAGADLLLVGLGSPRQEMWMARWLPQTGARIAIGIGGTLDVFAGRVPLAPPWIRAAGIEWLYRLIREPRRWRTAGALPGVMWMAILERVRPRGDSRSSEGY